jgi:hypothetical protein
MMEHITYAWVVEAVKKGVGVNIQVDHAQKEGRVTPFINVRVHPADVEEMKLVLNAAVSEALKRQV